MKNRSINVLLLCISEKWITVSPNIWTQVATYIYNNDNHYTKSASLLEADILFYFNMKIVKDYSLCKKKLCFPWIKKKSYESLALYACNNFEFVLTQFMTIDNPFLIFRTLLY